MLHVMFSIGISCAVAAVPAAGAADAPAPGPLDGFIENLGQWESPARFGIPGRDAALAVDGDGILLWVLAPAATGAAPREATDGADPRAPARPGVHLRLDWLGASPARRLEGLERRPGVRHYLIGNDRARWRRDVPAFARVIHRGLYDGIDLVLRADAGRRIAYDLVIAPGADPSVVELAVRGGGGLSLRGDGALVIATEHGDVVQTAPRTWRTEADGTRVPVECRFALRGEDRFGFSVAGGIDPALPVTIDPTLELWTYFGGSAGDGFTAVRAGSGDEPVLVGSTQSLAAVIPYPATPGTFQSTPGGGAGGVLTRLTEDGTALIWSTYFAATSSLRIDHAEVHAVTQEIFIAGRLWGGIDFPITPGVIQENFGGGPAEGFATRFAADGSDLVYSTFIGGSDREEIHEVALHDDGRFTVMGEMWPSAIPLPTTPGAYLAVAPFGTHVCFVCELTPDGSSFVFSTFFPGDDFEAGAVAPDGSIYIAGHSTSATFPATPGAFDPAPYAGGSWKSFIARLDATGSSLLAATLIHDAGTDELLIDPLGRPILIGIQNEPDLPVTPDAYSSTLLGSGDMTIVRFDPDLTQVEYATYFGGALGAESPSAAVLDPTGALLIVGGTGTMDFPVTADAFDPTYAGTSSLHPFDGFLIRFDPAQPGSAALRYGTLLGGTESEQLRGIALDSQDRVLIAGTSYSAGLPTTAGAIQGSLLGIADGLFIRFHFFGVGFRRGDINDDAALDISDAVALLAGLFAGAPIPCSDAADANDDGAVDVADAIRVLGVLFVGGTPPLPAPGPSTCGNDPTSDGLGCAASSCP